MKFGILIFINCVFWIMSPVAYSKPDSSERTAITLQLPWKHQFEFVGFYAAIEQGYYQEFGLDVEIKVNQKGLDLIDEVVSARAQYGIGIAFLVIEKSYGVPVVNHSM